MNKKDSSGKRPRIVKVTQKKATEKRSEAMGFERPIAKTVRRSGEGKPQVKEKTSFQKNETGGYTKNVKGQPEKKQENTYRTEGKSPVHKNTPERRFRTEEGSAREKYTPEIHRETSDRFRGGSKPQNKDYTRKKKFSDEANSSEKKPLKTYATKHRSNSPKANTTIDDSKLIRLNKYLADAGICSRREADDLIKAGVVSVNGRIVSEVGTKVKPEDKVVYGGQTLNREKPRYILLNKPKGYITTSDDPYERKTVMELVKGACDERIYPVGRLDRNTLGLLLFTNDGELAKKLMHPRHGVKKLYHVELDKPLTKNDLLKIGAGVELEDGIADVDKISWVNTDDSKKEVGIEIHSGKNRIVRRIFESLGYKVIKLDRVTFAGLTKLNLPRGRWRHLSPKEIGMLKSIK